MITFSPAELEILKREAEEAKQIRKQAGLRIESYQEKRLEFVSEWIRGQVFITVDTKRWALKIIRELTAARKKLAGTAGPGASRRGAGSKSGS